MAVKLMAVMFLIICCAVWALAQSPDATGKQLLRVSALKINVDDMDKALAFYTGKLGFDVADRSDYPREVVLRTSESFKLILNKVERLRKTTGQDGGVGFTLQVNDLNEAIRKMKSLGVPFAETTPRKEGVGNAIYILDPFGRKISLMHQTIVKVEPFKEPRIYNFGLLIPDMTLGRDFYENKLGFVARSEKYLPLDMPLGNTDKTFAFMLHYRQGVLPIKNDYPKAAPFVMIVFETDDLAQTAQDMKQKGVNTKAINKGKALVFEDPFGNVSELVESKK